MADPEEEATRSECVDASDKETEPPSLASAPAEAGEPPSLASAPAEAGEPGPSHGPAPTGSAEGSGGGDATNAATAEAASAGATSTAGGVDDAGTSTASDATVPPTVTTDAPVTPSTGVLPTVVETAVTDASQTATVGTEASLTVGTPVSPTVGDAVSPDRSQTMVSRDTSQTVRESVSTDASQTVRESVSTDASQTVRESVSTDASQTAGESVSDPVDTDATTGEKTACGSPRRMPPAEPPPPEAHDDDARDEMEVGVVKVEEDDQKPPPEGTPVVAAAAAAAAEGGSNTDSSSRNSPDQTDVDEKMDTGTDGQMDRGTTVKGEEDKSKLMEVDSTDSKPPIVDAGKDSLRGLENGVKGEPVKVVQDKPGQPAAKLESSRAEAPPPGPSPPPSPPLLKVKDEPIDEEYEQALEPNTGNIKDEPDTFEDFGQQQRVSEDLKISAVFSVGGASTVNVALPLPVAAAPRAVLTPTVVPAPTAPPLIPSALRVACSACKKVLMKGQTAYQRKGSSDLFCSTNCLTSHGSHPPAAAPPPPRAPTSGLHKTCHYCLKEIFNPKDVIIAPVDTTGTTKFFCSQSCLSAFDFKRNSAASVLSTTKGTRCSMCKKNCISRHEVMLQGSMHRLCGEDCFNRFRSSHKLSMNSCQHCNSYCYGKVHQLVLDSSTMTFCRSQCLTAFKQKTKQPWLCTMCCAQRPVSYMTESTDANGKTELFCSPSCVTAHKVQAVSASGTPMDCNTCGKKTVPSYHLAMSDGSIRNFCTLGCVVTFQDQFRTGQGNILQTLTPGPAAPSQTQAQTQAQTQTQTQNTTTLTCFQCHRLFSSKPELVQLKNKVVFLCGLVCSENYRSSNAVIGRCEYCKVEKVTKEVKRINKKDCSFCSEGCKLLYKHDLAKRWGKHCRACAFCSTTSQKVVTGQYDGRTEEFCSDECKSSYTLLFCQVSKCDECGHLGKLNESLPLLGEVKHFCNIKCLLHFCAKQIQGKTQSQPGQRAVIMVPPTTTPTTTAVWTPSAKDANPVIGNVVSLASTPTGQPNVFANTALQGAVPSAAMRILGNASTQTDVVKGPPPPPPRILKNKALLCKPMVQNKGVMCKPLTTTIETQTEDRFPHVLILPVPVPVFIPVPMNLYSQYVPQPVGLPIPVPVPMFLPVTLDNAESIVKTIQEIKAKIPSNPFEADMILMAEMVAEEAGEEEKEGREERCKPASAVPDDQGSSYSGDLDTEDLTTSFLNWEEEPTSSRLSRSLTNERLQPVTDNHVPAEPPAMDLEADFPIETLELMAHWRDQSPPPPPSPQRRPRRKTRDSFPSKKRRKSRTAAAAAEPSTPLETPVIPGGAVPGEPPKLQHLYGVDAWRRWVQWRSTQPDLEEKPRFTSRQMVLKEDVLKCTTAELGYGLCRFIGEARRPNQDAYSPDSIFYLCLGIQQHLFENGRMENIFTDLFYCKFTGEITKLLKQFQPTVTASGYLHSRVEEEYLWGCKQLGAYSPIVLLNTLLFFCTKMFRFKTPPQHRQLSFAHVMRCTKTNHDNTKTNFLRFYPPIPKGNFVDKSAEADGVAAKRKREEEEKEVVLEMVENSENPLRCPVRLYEFYLSKCSESVKQRSNVFYLHPERSCVPNSPLWFSSTALDESTMETMLTRILTVREIHLDTEGKDQLPAPPDHDSDWTE